MKLTNRTTPQAKHYQCDKCKSILCHKDMYDDKICYECYDKEENLCLCGNKCMEECDVCEECK